MVLKTGFPKIGISSAKYDTSITTCIQQFNLSDQIYLLLILLEVLMEI